MDSQRLRSLLSKVGAEFVAYSASTTAAEVSAMANGDAIISTPVANATNELHTLIDRYFPVSEQPPGATIDVNAHLDMLNMATLMGFQYEGNSIGNAIRLLTGGSLPVASNATSDLERKLARLAVDIYPLLLLPRDTKDNFPDYMNISSMITSAVFRNDYGDFFDAVEADDVLRGVYADDATGSERLLKTMFYSLNTGVGSSQQLVSLPTDLIQYAYYKNKIEGQTSPTALIEQVVESFRMFRKLVDGTTASTTAYAAINGLVIPDGIVMDLPWGKLRAPTDFERTLLSPRAQLMNAVLEVPFTLKLKKHRSFSSAYPFANDRERENVEDAAMLTSAAVMVALGKEVRVENVGTIIMQIIGHGPSTSWPLEKYGVAQTRLGSSERAKVTRIGPTIWEHRQHLNIPLRRNIMAIGRVDALDGFIDGITAMEGLFGADKETTFTVSAAMAKFLETDLQSRKDLKKEIANDLYSERSKIVHGVTFPPATTIEMKRQRVIDLNILALRKLLRYRHDLIGCSSSDRAAKILLS